MFIKRARHVCLALLMNITNDWCQHFYKCEKIQEKFTTRRLFNNAIASKSPTKFPLIHKNSKKIANKLTNNLLATIKYPRRESNPDLRFRKPSFYPLNYGGIA